MRPVAATLAVLLIAAPGPAWATAFPEQVQVAGERLTLNGKSTFRKWFFSVYDVGLYLERPADSVDEVLSFDGVKRLHLRLLRDVPREKMVNLLRWRLQTVAGAGYAGLEPRVKTLLDAIPDAKAGSDLFITWVPGRGTVLEVQGRQALVIPGKDFADALFNVWLQDKRVRPGLLGS